MNQTKIEWVAGPNGEPKGFTWNPIVGCTHGCPWCYARRMAKRFGNDCALCRDFVPHLHGERLGQPADKKKPARIFVCSMGELFDPTLYTHERKDVFDAMLAAPQHTFIILTKRPSLAHRYLAHPDYKPECPPQPNWHLLTSVTNQADVDERVPQLLKLREYGWPVLGVSVEPLLGPVDLSPWLGIQHEDACGVQNPDQSGEAAKFLQFHDPWTQCLDWTIIGAQTGPGAVKPERAWVERIITDCRKAGTPVFVKDNIGMGKDIREYPK